MTILAFDGKTFVADGLSVNGDLVVDNKFKKLYLVDGACIGIAGSAYCGLAFVKWWKDGHDPKNYPAMREDSGCLVVYQDGTAEEYTGRTPVPIPAPSPPIAFGTGDMIALGAMAAGADARRAVEIACQLCTTCGGEIQVVTLDELKASADAFMSAAALECDRALANSRATLDEMAK